MDNCIAISQGGVSVAMPRTRDLQVGGEEVAKEAVMASGRVVKDVLGHRATLTAAWDWVPADTITALSALLRRGGFFQVSYPSPQGTAVGEFSIQFPTMRVFAFRRGVPMWHDVTLTMESREVE